MMFLWLPFLLLIPFAMFWMMRSGTGMGGCGMDHAGHAQTPSASGLDPIEIARQRLAQGEITTSEYEAIRRVIG
jgi:uncharacterized membrane protein